MNTVKRQKGITAIAIIAILAMLGFFVLIAIRLFPIYMEHFSVASHLEGLAEERLIKEKTDKEILKTLRKRFNIDDVVNVKEENIFIERKKDTALVDAIVPDEGIFFDRHSEVVLPELYIEIKN